MNFRKVNTEFFNTVSAVIETTNDRVNWKKWNNCIGRIKLQRRLKNEPPRARARRSSAKKGVAKMHSPAITHPAASIGVTETRTHTPSSMSPKQVSIRDDDVVPADKNRRSRRVGIKPICRYCARRTRRSQPRVIQIRLCGNLTLLGFESVAFAKISTDVRRFRNPSWNECVSFFTRSFRRLGYQVILYSKIASELASVASAVRLLCQGKI